MIGQWWRGLLLLLVCDFSSTALFRPPSHFCPDVLPFHLCLWAAMFAVCMLPLSHLLASLLVAVHRRYKFPAQRWALAEACLALFAKLVKDLEPV